MSVAQTTLLSFLEKPEACNMVRDVDLCMSPSMWNYTRVPLCLAFYMDATDPNAGAQDCTASTVQTEPSLHPSCPRC